MGVITRLTDLIDEGILLHYPELKIVCNMAVGYRNAVGYHNIDIKADQPIVTPVKD